MPDQDQESLSDHESRRHRRLFSLKTVLFEQCSPLFLQEKSASHFYNIQNALNAQ